MAVTYLVTYDLNSPGQNYQKVLEVIQMHPQWRRLSESSYAVNSAETPDQLYRRFAAFLDPNDTLFIIKLQRYYGGQGTDQAVAWLNDFLI